MKFLSLLLLISALFAADIHHHGIEVPFIPVPDANPTIISFSNGIVFDTKQGEPTLPQDLTISEYNGDGYYLVQVKGPVYQMWLKELENAGIEIVGYIPKYSLIVHANQEELDFINAKSFVQWSGILQPAYKLQRELMDAKGTAQVTIQLFSREDVNQTAIEIQKMGFDVVEVIDHEIAKTIDVIGDLSRINEIAKIPGVLWIQLWSEPIFFNDNCQWVTQTGWQSTVPPDPGARRIWYKGIKGSGIILSTSDSGITTGHDQFYDAAYPITAPGVFPNHRKIIGYKLYPGAAFGDVPTYHGTHVSCTAAGNDTMLGTSPYDGMAKQTRIYFVDIANNAGGLVLPSNLTTLYDSIYPGNGLSYNILQHSGSWGWPNYSGTYLIQDATTDAYAWKHKDFLNLYAAANSGPGGMTVANPGIAKNVLTVGATQNGIYSNSIYSHSSRGYTKDRRIKPNIMAPGQSLLSADGGDIHDYVWKHGTSMATPAANGSVALIRQYLLAGFYPSGSANPADSIKYQSAALLRAMAIVSCDPNIGSWVPPDSNIGWGRINVDSVLYFTGEARKLILKDDTIGISASGHAIIDSFYNNSDVIPLRVCLAWTDTAAAPNADSTLVNDVNLTLRAPSGTSYNGNIYSGGESTPNPPGVDDRNVEECCRINSPELGKWFITVSGQSIVYTPQPFAYAITGDIATGPGIEEGHSMNPQIERISFSSITTGKIRLKINLLSPQKVEARVFDLTGRIVETIVNSELPAGENVCEHKTKLPTGVYFVEVKTGNTSRQIGKILIVR